MSTLSRNFQNFSGRFNYLFQALSNEISGACETIQAVMLIALPSGICLVFPGQSHPHQVQKAPRCSFQRQTPQPIAKARR
jgi:hypothetical protein